jgi:hypothetical protein
MNNEISEIFIAVVETTHPNFFFAESPQWARVSPVTRFLDHTQ